MAQVRAPKGGIEVGNQFFKGGQYLPGEARGLLSGSGMRVAGAKRAKATRYRNGVMHWRGEAANQRIESEMAGRVALATHWLKTKVVKNISIPVERRGGVVIRSKPGEFPRADTTLLRSSIFAEVRREGPALNGYVGTPVKYAMRLEFKMRRSFLVRTLREERGNIKKIMTRPMTR